MIFCEEDSGVRHIDEFLFVDQEFLAGRTAGIGGAEGEEFLDAGPPQFGHPVVRFTCAPASCCRRCEPGVGDGVALDVSADTESIGVTSNQRRVLFAPVAKELLLRQFFSSPQAVHDFDQDFAFRGGRFGASSRLAREAFRRALR